MCGLRRSAAATVECQPLHTDAPESEHATVLAHFAEVFAATFFAEQPPAVEPAAAATPEVRATGGPINADTPYLVGGDGGPEIFLPGSNGSIVPNATDHKKHRRINKENPRDGSTDTATE
jgi:hypothetical protein